MKKIILLICLLSSVNLLIAQDNYQLRQYVHDHLAQSNSNFHFAMLGEIYYEEKAAAIFWPCLINGNFVDDKVYALIFEKDGTNWITTGLTVTTSPNGKAELIELMGGPTYRVKRKEGVVPDSIADLIYERTQRIGMLTEEQNAVECIKAIEELSECFSMDRCAFGKTVQEYAMHGIKSVEFRDIILGENAGTARMEIFFEGRATEYKASLLKFQDGWVLDKME